jgi:hypothetical protein
MVMRELSWANSGDDLYLVNSRSQSSPLMGGREPVTGRHSVMLRLDKSAMGPLRRGRVYTPGLGESRQSPEDDDTEDAGSTAQQPVCHHLVAGLGEAARLCRALGGSLGHDGRLSRRAGPQWLRRRPSYGARNGRLWWSGDAWSRNGHAGRRLEAWPAHKEASREPWSHGSQLGSNVEDGGHVVVVVAAARVPWPSRRCSIALFSVAPARYEQARLSGGCWSPRGALGRWAVPARRQAPWWPPRVRVSLGVITTKIVAKLRPA